MRDPWSENSAWDARDEQREALPGVIDTLGNGFAALWLRPFAVLPLIVLDLILLMTPRVTIAPLSARVSSWAQSRGEGWEEIAAEADRLSGVNVLDLAILRVPLVQLPALVPSLSATQRTDSGWTHVSNLLSMAGIGAIALLALLGGFVVSALYRSMAASAVTIDEPLVRSLLPRRVAWTALRLAGWTLAVLGLIALIAMPVAVLTLVGAIFGVTAIALLWIVLFIPLAWGFVHFYFSVHALVLDGDGVFPALRSSYRVVHGYFWQSVRFIALTFVISIGFTYLMAALAGHPAGVFLAIIGNAVIATGMAVAAMLFYRDRARRLHPPADILASGR